MLTALLLLALAGTRHPIHSSSAVVTIPPGGGSVSVTLRVFADDFPPGPLPVPAARYLAERFRVSDSRGRAVPLTVVEIRAEGVVLILTLTAPAPDGLVGARIWHGVLAERFPDQVNLVQVHRGTRSASLLFTATDGPKPLP